MRVPVSWLREHVDLPTGSVEPGGADANAPRPHSAGGAPERRGVDADAVEHALVEAGLEVEEIVDLAGTVTGPLVVGRVRSVELLTGFKKEIRFCQVDVGEPEPRGIVCGAPNVTEGALVVVALPGAVLPGGFAIAARKTYGRVSDGMICSGRELGVSDDHDGIIVLPPDAGPGAGAEPGGAAPGAGPQPGQDARPLVGLDDIVVDLEITPDRGYCHSIRGIARELAHAFGVPLRDPADIEAPGATAEPPYPVTVADPVGCDRFAARLVRGIDPAVPAPDWMRRRLAVAGIRSISLAVDITNYVMLELGQPMHAFDPARLAGPLLVRRALPGERLTTLDGIDRELSVEDMVICDTGLPAGGPAGAAGSPAAASPAGSAVDADGGAGPVAGGRPGVPVSLAAVMGGENSEMRPESTDVLFEAAHWDPVMVSRTARRHRLLSEAAKRWERGVDPALPLVALERAVTLLTRYAGGTLDPRVLDIDHRVPPRPVRLATGLPAATAGVPYPPGRVVELLTAVGCRVEPATPAPAAGPGGPGTGAGPEGSGVPSGTAGTAGAQAGDGAGVLVVTPPSWRPDLTDPADLVEEVIRLDGYANVPSVLPLAPPGNGLTAGQRRRRTVGRALAESGYVEVLAYPFVGVAALDALGLPPDDPDRAAVRLANPLSEAEPLLRTTLLPGLLAILRRNLGRGQRDVALYELGLVFRPPAAASAPPAMGVAGRPSDEDLAATDAALPRQPWHVAAVLAGDAEPAGWWGTGRPAGWADAVAAARTVLSAAGLPEPAAGGPIEIRAGRRAPWHPGRCAEIVVAGRVAGYAGELHPGVCAALDVPPRTVAMELDLDALPPAGAAPAPRISTYPPARIDVALVVDADTPAAAVRAALVEGAGPLLESVNLFDVYTAEQLGAGRKSLAYKLTFRAADRTLTAQEAVAARDAAVAVAAGRFGAVLRGA